MTNYIKKANEVVNKHVGHITNGGVSKDGNLESLIVEALKEVEAQTWRKAAKEIYQCREHGNDDSWCAAGLSIEFDEYAMDALKGDKDEL